ncbi:DUF1833 family protein [Serratia liquefaciens]|jgi:Domain of unknown function (DUF1833).|uniref:DUF1833 domain-containing protein n=1 Tax=Serratia liquefaciens TaxID=614 RepID=A0A379ZDP4_SERLI|nr:DUF1833 family protein [Serratia liquefaciens]MBF8103882.1 DUF1833 family protein [Serratia liquefaciens]QDL32369.1 DUF1833 domain-containing protein [Serratia liquefaciens]QNQ52296.1 DUF1833 family protein [Serratia liquefaciens]RYM87988.1 hypothetical protein BSR02_05755 [Serratia liquefaciens]SUI59040.1 Uncharacterised protein [Serratia liquefaciens]
MPTLREFQSQRPNRILYDTMTFYHSTFGYIRLVNRQIYPKTFAGQVYTPCRMEVSESQQSNTPVINATVKFGRLAQDFKQQLKLWRTYSRITPISATYQRFDAADMNTPLKPWTLYVKDVSMDESDVTCSLTLQNPLNNNIAFLYNTTDFPGLANA